MTSGVDRSRATPLGTQPSNLHLAISERRKVRACRIHCWISRTGLVLTKSLLRNPDRPQNMQVHIRMRGAIGFQNFMLTGASRAPWGKNIDKHQFTISLQLSEPFVGKGLALQTPGRHRERQGTKA